MSEAVTKLAGVFANHASITITYSRGDSGVGGIPATVGRTLTEMLTGDVMVLYENRDFLIQSALLILDGELVVPKNGDRITEASGQAYEVLELPGQPCWAWIDGGREVMRIHAKMIDAEGVV